MSACADLAAGASSGVAPALSAVDCLANEMAAGAFARLFGSEGSLLPALTILLTLYIGLFAFALITGRSRLGVSVLTPRMMMLGLVLTFATSWMAWQQVVWNLAIGGPDQIAAAIMGAKGPATQLFANRIDLVIGAVAQVGEATGGGQGPQAAASGGAFSPQGLMWLGTTLLLLGTVGVLVTARIALAVMLATGPVFVVLALFRSTRGLTAGWLRGLVLSALTPLFVVVGGSLMLELAAPVVAALGGVGEGQAGVDARAAMALFLIASVHCALMVMMIRVASTIVSAWNAFGLAGQERDDVRAAPLALPAPATYEAASPAATAGTSAARPRAAMVAQPVAASAPADTAPAGAPAVSVRRSTTMVQSAPQAASALPQLPRTRARGIGSRFANHRPATLREMTR